MLDIDAKCPPDFCWLFSFKDNNPYFYNSLHSLVLLNILLKKLAKQKKFSNEQNPYNLPDFLKYSLTPFKTSINFYN